MGIENWVIFGVNLVFTGFNAWVAWQNWKRASATDRPSLSVRIYASRDVPAAELEIVATNGTAVAWRAVGAELVEPATKTLYYPLVVMLQDRFGQPVPQPLDLSDDRGARRVTLAAQAPAGGHSREVLWVTKAKPGQRIRIRLTYESTEPQPRRYRTTVTRSAPALKQVITT